MQLTGTAGQKGGAMFESFAWYVGIDWGNEAHLLCLMDAHGYAPRTRLVAHTAVAVHDAIQWVLRGDRSDADGIAVGLERPRGVLVDTWLERGFPVFAVNPKQLDRFRDRFTAGWCER